MVTFTRGLNLCDVDLHDDDANGFGGVEGGPGLIVGGLAQGEVVSYEFGVVWCMLG